MKKQAIRIGVVLPLSGHEELFGTEGLQGARMAVAEVLRSGGASWVRSNWEPWKQENKARNPSALECQQEPKKAPDLQ